MDKHQEETEEEAVYEEAPEAAIYEDTEPLAYIDPTPVSYAYLYTISGVHTLSSCGMSPTHYRH